MVAIAAARDTEARKIAQGGHAIAQPQLDFLEMALSGKNVGFEKVIVWGLDALKLWIHMR